MPNQPETRYHAGRFSAHFVGAIACIAIVIGFSGFLLALAANLSAGPEPAIAPIVFLEVGVAGLLGFLARSLALAVFDIADAAPRAVLEQPGEPPASEPAPGQPPTALPTASVLVHTPLIEEEEETEPIPTPERVVAAMDESAAQRIAEEDERRFRGRQP